MYPEWQRELIKMVINLKNIIERVRDKKIQFVLTSHTPILVNKLHEGNIVFVGELQK